MTEAQNLEFGVVSLSTSELDELSVFERNFLIAASFIVNDIRFYWSLMMRSPVNRDANDLASMQMVRWLWCTRKLASVISEAQVTLDQFCGKIPRLKSIVKQGHPILTKECRNSDCFKIAKLIRNKVTSHYAIVGLDKFLYEFKNNDEHRIFAHEMRGNSVSEISEQIFTLPNFAGTNKRVSLEEFNDWCQDASSTILHFCDFSSADILLAAFPKKTFKTQLVEVGKEAASFDEIWPLFVKPNSIRRTK